MISNGRQRLINQKAKGKDLKIGKYTKEKLCSKIKIRSDSFISQKLKNKIILQTINLDYLPSAEPKVPSQGAQLQSQAPSGAITRSVSSNHHESRRRMMPISPQ